MGKQTARLQIGLTRRDREILRTLSLRVRLFSQRQIAEHWWAGEISNARRRLKQLTHSGFVDRVMVNARSLPAIECPIVSWQPNEDTPEFGQIAYRLQTRWQKRAVRATAAFVASRQTAQQFAGSGGELKQPTQATHDLGVAAVWIRVRSVAPDWAEAWKGEDQLAHTRRGQKLPDAFIVNEAGATVCVVEFGGSYDTARVRDFHEDCMKRKLPYQIW